ncbi:MAG: shikimate kinase [Actinobacteria bacterium]|nr:shikimate kinase [Actinomycetota bacterium]
MVADGARHVVLVGMMGTGKTTVGRHVAALLGRPFFDSDEVVAQRADRSVREIFEQDGEPAFRRLESAVMAELLGGSQPSVIAGGGGAVLDEGTRVRLARSADVVWLRASPRLLAGRLARGGDHRPLLDGHDEDVAAVLADLGNRRDPIYESVADHIVDIDDRGPQRMAQAVVEVVS